MSGVARMRSDEKRGSAALWFGVLGGPAAWVIQMAGGYILEETACSPASRSTAILGIEIVPLFSVMTAVLALTTAAAGITAFRCRGRIEDASATVTSERSAWMALAGVAVSALFFVIIILAFAAFAILSPCEVPL